MPTRRLWALCPLLVGLAGAWPLMASAQVFGPPPTALDCDAMPCAEILPGAGSFRAVEGAPYQEGLDDDGEVVGWVALSTDFVDLAAYSGKPMITLVGLDPDGVITGARVVHHSEPILLVGIPESALREFADFYAGKRALQRIVVGRADKPGVLSIDGISGATVTALVQNNTVLETARSLGTSVGVFPPGAITLGHFVEEPEPWTFQQMIEAGALGRLEVSKAELGAGEDDEPYVDLVFGVVDPEHIGRSILGDRTYEFRMSRLEPGEHLFVIFNRGSGSFKGSAFVRGGIFDRVRVQQGLQELTFRDTDYWNVPDIAADDAPEMQEGGLFVLRGGRFNPGLPYELVFLGSRYDRRGAFSRDFREFTAAHQLPETLYVVDQTISGIPWRQAWRNRQVHVAILGVYLLAVVLVFASRPWSTVDLRRLSRLHLASMVFGFVVMGVVMGAQPSVTQMMTAVGSLVGQWRWDLFLSEPLIFLSWIFITFVSLIWGRGVFCGWVCPYGAMNELAFMVSKRLGFAGYELPDGIHEKLRYARYVVLFVLLGVFLVDSVLAEAMAEVEPFKSTFLVPIWTRPLGFVAWWGLLLAAAFLMYRPFCRYLCPMGAGLSLLSSFRPAGPRRRAFCSSCKICTRGCEPRAFRKDGSIDQRECLSCMECEATYYDKERCPPLIGLSKLEEIVDLSERDRARQRRLQAEVADA